MSKKQELTVATPEPVSLDEPVEKPEKTAEAAETPKEPAKPEAVDKKDEEDAPPAPPRPVSPTSALKNELKAAFPKVEDRLITAVLIASQGNMESAFNALLFISDETMEEPPILAAAAPPPVEDDEALARRLQKKFESEDRRRRPRKSGEARRRHQPEDDSPDEFDQIKETFSQGLEEARTTLNGWVSGFAKKFGDNEEKPKVPPKNPKLFGALGGSSFNSRRNSKFDEDPEILSNDFHNKINLNDNDDKAPELPKRKSEEDQKKWQPLNSDVPINSDSFLVTDSEEEDKKETV